MKHIIPVWAFFLFILPAFIGAQIDNSIYKYKQLPNDEHKVKFGNDLVKEISSSMPKAGLDLAKENYELAEKIGYEYGIAEAISRIGWAYDFNNIVDSAVYYYQLGIEKHQLLGNLKEIADNTFKSGHLLA